jgi:AAA domain
MAHVEVLLGKSPNTLQWDLAGLNRGKFEDLVAGAIQDDLHRQSASISCAATPRTGDRGSDLIIEADRPITLCGVPLHPNRQRRLRACVEIKSKMERTRTRLDERSYGRSITQLNDLEYDYFVLITNTSVTPRAVRQTTDLLASRGIEFVVIDEERLYRFLMTSPMGQRFIAHTSRPGIDASTTFVAEAQIHRVTVDDNIDLVIDLWLRNYGNESSAVEVALEADSGWLRQPAGVERTIEDNRDMTVKFSAKAAMSGEDDVAIVFRIGSDLESVAHIRARGFGFDFTPPLQGRDHHRAIAEIRDIIALQRPFAFISIAGEAGTGKTRIVTDAIQATSNPSRLIHRAVIERNQPDRAIADLCQRVERSLDRSIVTLDGLSAGARLRALVEALDHEFYSVVLVLEDVHHAAEDVINALKDLLALERDEESASVTLIVTGRDDFTFPNEVYFSLLDMIGSNTQSGRVYGLKVQRLTSSDTRALIRSIVDDVPADALARIERLSGNVPFCVLQVIEHLLEAGIAELRRANRVGIPNPFTFASRRDIPDSMSEIYEARIATLRRHGLGVEAWAFLCVASEYGQSIPEYVVERAAGSANAASTLDLVLARHFLKSSYDGVYEWFHENWLHVVRRMISQEQLQKNVACQVLDDPLMRNDFEGLALGRLLSIAGRHQEARTVYDPAIEAALRVDNLSAVAIDAVYFPHYPHVFETLRSVGESGDTLVHVLLAEAYLGNHAISGLIGLQAIRSTLRRIGEVNLAPSKLNIATARLRQLETHSVMEVGQIGLAEQQLLELATRVQLDDQLRTAYDVQFDLYNRLQDIYRLRNHLRLAEDYGELAEGAAQHLGGASLVMSRFDTALIYHYVDPARCVRLHEAALAFATNKGVEQNIICGRIGMTAARLSLEWRHFTKIPAILDELGTLLKIAIRRPYAPLIARCYLLIAVCNYLLAAREPSRLDLAESYTDAGINAAINYSAGFDVWQLYNMRAILATRRRESPRKIERYFNSAIDDLRASNLLGFGSLDVCFENIVVASNFIKFLHRSAHKSQLREFVREIRFYEKHERDVGVLGRDIVDSVEKYGILMQSKTMESVIFDDATGYCIPAPC